jgi:hypothetical protein
MNINHHSGLNIMKQNSKPYWSSNVKRVILIVFVFSLLACTAPDDDSSAGNSEAQNPPPAALTGNSEAQTPPPAALAENSEAQTPSLDALGYYLNLKKLGKDQMHMGENGALENSERRQIMDESGEPVFLVHSIKLITSGASKDRQAFLVQESYTQPDEMFPQHDRYMCTLLVFISRGGGWQLEHNDMFNESDDNGVTRRKEPCDGFELAWEDKFPVLLSAAGKVSLQDGKYVLESGEGGVE